MAKLKIVLFKSKKLKDGRHPIMVRIAHKDKMKYVATGLSAFPTEWVNDQLSNEYKKNHKLTQPAFEKVKATLRSKQDEVFDLSQSALKTGKSTNVENIVTTLKNDKKQSTFDLFTTEIIQEMNLSGRVGNADVYTQSLHILRAFCGKDTITFESITHGFLLKLQAWHLSKKNKKGEPNSLNSLATYLRTVRAVFNRAIKEGLIDEKTYPFKTYQIGKSPVRKRAISLEAIRKIEALDVPFMGSLWHTKNWFMFSFYCMGMNWVDMCNLKIKNLVNGRIEYERQKTKRKSVRTFSIKINHEIDRILSWYIEGKEPNDYVFPILYGYEEPAKNRRDIKNKLQTFNGYLQTLADSAGVQGDITSYVSRHSWASVISDLSDLKTTSAGLGHANQVTTQLYLAEINRNELDKANELIIK